MAAARSDQLKAIEFLLSVGAKIDQTTKTGKTALIVAAENCCVLSCHLLVNSGADVNLQDVDGMTALMLAAREGAEKIVRLFVDKRGALISLCDSQGRTALTIAAEKRHKGVCSFLFDQSFLSF